MSAPEPVARSATHFPSSHRRTPRLGGPLWSALERVDAVFDRLAGSAHNPLYQTGPLIVVALLILAVTGVYLFLFYSVSAPYETMERIQAQPFAGRWLRALHRYAADASLVLTVIHAVRLFLQGRTWGQRALAWISGVIMSVFLLVCGWTGFILVWDAQGHAIALQGARVLDLLPLFPEPIRGQFVSDATLGSMFFFANLFAHVALPLGLALFLWIHVARIARPIIFPPRPLLLAMIGSLVALSILVPIDLDARAALDRLPGAHDVDWLFQFWLPLADMPWIAAAFWLSTGGLLVTAPWWWRPRRGERAQASTVNERLCEGCRQCYVDCPYEAIEMVPRTLGVGSAEVARVTPDLCVSCGVCSSSCDVFRVGPPGRTGKDQLISLRSLIDEKPPQPDEVVVFACTQSAQRMRALARPGLVVVPVECAGNLHMFTIHAALKRGARGVVVWSCPPRNCQFREGAHWLRERLEADRKAALPEGVDKTRILLVDAGPGEMADALARIDAFCRTLRGGAAPAVPAGPSQAARVGGRVVAAAVLCGALGAGTLSTTGATREHAMLRLAWRHDVGLLERCRTPSEAELASLPLHMRRPRICERRYPALHVRARIDGDTVVDRVLEPGGARKDRAPSVLLDVDVTAGQHAVSIDVTPIVSADEAGDGATAPLTFSQSVSFERAGVYRVSFDRTTHALELVRPAAR